MSIPENAYCSGCNSRHDPQDCPVKWLVGTHLSTDEGVSNGDTE